MRWTVDFDIQELPEVLSILGTLRDLGHEPPQATAVLPPGPDIDGDDGAAALPPQIAAYLAQYESAGGIDDARLLLAQAADSYVLEAGGSRSEPYVMVFMRGPRQIGALAYVRPRSGDLRLRLPKESAANYAHGTANPNQRLYQVDVPLSAPLDELMAALAEASDRGQGPDRWSGDPEVTARREAARRAREGDGS